MCASIVVVRAPAALPAFAAHLDASVDVLQDLRISADRVLEGEARVEESCTLAILDVVTGSDWHRIRCQLTQKRAKLLSLVDLGHSQALHLR